jgi:hypothetical protein
MSLHHRGLGAETKASMKSEDRNFPTVKSGIPLLIAQLEHVLPTRNENENKKGGGEKNSRKGRWVERTRGFLLEHDWDPLALFQAESSVAGTLMPDYVFFFFITSDT